LSRQEPSPEGEAQELATLADLPDGCAWGLERGGFGKVYALRVAYEFVVDVMVRASGLSYEEALGDVGVREVDGVPIPFASTESLLSDEEAHAAESGPW